MPAWFITGCSTGLGRSLAEAVLDRGYNAVGTARDPATGGDIAQAHPETALALPLDVTEQAQVTRAVQQAEERFGGVSVLVNNAGYGYRAAVEEGDDADVRQLFGTHFFGAVALMKAVLPGMRSRREGAIINISSIGARTSQPGSGYYAAAKAAIEGLSASLRKEVGPLGITVMVVEPGPAAFALTSPGAHSSSHARPSPTTPTPPGNGARRTSRGTAPSPATRPRRLRRSSRPSRPPTRPPCSCSGRTPSAASAAYSTPSAPSWMPGSGPA
jgi:NAD(P)-dependent dehydrogenase (short-subunit alcohol dehydrogenase family)